MTLFHIFLNNNKQRDNMNFKSKDYGDCFCNIIISEDISIV
jgi:hypothetical protein